MTSAAVVTTRTRPIPALLNPASGSAARALDVLQVDSRFQVRALDAQHLADAVRVEALTGTRRMLVCGGDGTLAAALAAAAGTALEIAVLPGGTLNHFARDIGLPHNDPAAALNIAVNGPARAVALGYVNGHAILNTSSVGFYVDFVRERERLEHRLSYPLASVAAAISSWRNAQPLVIDLVTADGKQRRVETPLFFVGIQERVLEGGMLGRRRPNGARALHVLVVKEHTPLRFHALVLRAILRGLHGLLSPREVATTLTSSLMVTLPLAQVEIAIDGELVPLTSPLRYEIVPAAVKVVHP
jgi:diacylglycerol kinase family enzyme